MQVECVDKARALCGEGLLWDHTRQCLWWVDIAGETLHRFDPTTGAGRVVDMPWLISALALAGDGGLLIASARGVGRVDPDSGAITALWDPEPGLDGNRLNDMIAGPDGSLWVGTMSEGAKAATGALYQYGPEGTVKKRKTGTTISNGMGWSPDGKTLYFIDSVPGELFQYRGGAWSSLRKFDDTTGKPDGMTVDADGTLWIAICDRGRVISVTPEGEITGQIELPCEIVTNCTFGGADLRKLYITTGTFSMTPEERQANPLAGGLFAVEMDVPGLPSFAANWPMET